MYLFEGNENVSSEVPFFGAFVAALHGGESFEGTSCFHWPGDQGLSLQGADVWDRHGLELTAAGNGHHMSVENHYPSWRFLIARLLYGRMVEISNPHDWSSARD